MKPRLHLLVGLVGQKIRYDGGLSCATAGVITAPRFESASVCSSYYGCIKDSSQTAWL